MSNQVQDFLDEYDDIDTFQKFEKRPKFSKPKMRKPKEESVQNSRRRKEKERQEMLEDSNIDYLNQKRGLCPSFFID